MKRNKNKNNKNPNGRGYRLARQGTYTSIQKPKFSFLDPHLYITLRYTGSVSASVTTLTAATYIFNLNSLFDPDRTGAGGQPYGFDQIAALYNRYRPLKASWKVKFTNSTGAYATLVGPANGLLAANPTTAGTFFAATMNPRFQHKLLGVSTPGNNFEGSVALNDLNGCTMAEYLADDRFEAVITATPSEVLVLYTSIYNDTGSTIATLYTVEIDYEVDFHDPILLGSS